MIVVKHKKNKSCLVLAFSIAGIIVNLFGIYVAIDWNIVGMLLGMFGILLVGAGVLLTQKAEGD